MPLIGSKKSVLWLYEKSIDINGEILRIDVKIADTWNTWLISHYKEWQENEHVFWGVPVNLHVVLKLILSVNILHVVLSDPYYLRRKEIRHITLTIFNLFLMAL